MTKRKGGRKFLTKVEGVKRGDRQDAKLEKVIINEKKVKKVCIPVSLPLSHIVTLQSSSFRSTPAFTPYPEFFGITRI